MKINFIIIGICATVLGGSLLYIKWLQAENETLRANQAKLEQSIADQNESIKNYLANQKRQTEQITLLETQRQEAQRELSKLRDTFAKHDIGKLALAKPKLIENIVNKGTKKVKDDMIELTKPEQYD
jgi:septal ring factor EnvC (AmiA/AmiB activator)|tara:strand:- start:1264 stop:1644 length:381 start_codon:yes stop_codon:yes gene_type:complete